MNTAASLVAIILLGPFYPHIIARLGLKRSVVAGIFCAALVLPCMLFAESLPVRFGLRFITGCALGLSWIASEIWLNTASGSEARGTVMGLYGTIFSLGIVAGPSLLAFTGTRGWQPFVVGALGLIMTLAPLALLRLSYDSTK